MTKSNVIAESNVLLCKTENPWFDLDFVSQIQDYTLLKEYEKKRLQGENRIANYSEKQNDILSTELRCMYAKHDPCWGYVNKLKKIVSKCINGACPKIFECNPNYSLEDEQYWKPSEEAKLLYKNPDELRKYYFVDMISDEEMRNYCAVPKNEGIEYPILKDTWKKASTSGKKTKIDPATGRKMVIVGYQWRIVDNGNYEAEEMFPIWNYVDEVKVEETLPLFKKAKRIEKKNAPLETEVFKKREQYESSVKQKLIDEIKLAEFHAEIVKDTEAIVLFSNPAELAFASSTFITNNIEHGILVESHIMLALLDDFEKYSDREIVFISNNAIKKGCNDKNIDAWKLVDEKTQLFQLNVANRDFHQFDHEGNERWICGNLYGATHIDVKPEDIQLILDVENGYYPAIALREENSYAIYDEQNRKIGFFKHEFQELLSALEESGEIPGQPISINRIAVRIQNGVTEVQGMGHMKFQEY